MASYYSGSTLQAEDVAQLLYQAGVRGENLVLLTAIAKRESGYVTGAHRTDSQRSRLSGDRGLFQINSVWDTQLKAAGIIRTPSDLFDPLTNAKAAAYVLSKQGLQAWGMSSGGWDGNASPTYRTNVDEARAAVNRAQQSGKLAQDWNQGASTGTTGGGDLPSDAKLVSIDGQMFALFDLGSGVYAHYGVPAGFNTGGRPVERLSKAAFWKKYRGSVNSGNAEELKNVRANYGSFKAFWESILEQVLGSANPASNDPEVRRVLAEFAGRPDMSEAELQNKLKATKYWQSRTEGELQWNSLSEAERASRLKDMAARMAQAWFEVAGERISTNDSRIKQHLEAVASGKMGFSSWTETFLKPRARENPESPYSRQLRDEQEAQKQRGTDIENTVARLRETLANWGIRWSEGALLQWGKWIVGKTKSDDDFIQAVKQQAQTIFPTKDPEMETATWAAPYLEVYGRVMEEEGSVFTKDVARAMSNGESVWDFEQRLKSTSKWLETRNAREEMFNLAGEIGQRMGYV